MNLKIAMASLGCPKNQIDGEIMLWKLESAGFELTADESEAEVIIVNTCGFIESAKQEGINTILDIAGLKKTGKLKSLIITGCLAERYADELRKEIPEIDTVVQLGRNDDIVSIVKNTAKHGGDLYEGEKENLPICGERILLNDPYFAYIKIAEGCNNRCSYCAIPSIRGKMRSRKIEDIVAEAQSLAQKGVKELVVVAQDTTRYGEDIYHQPMLPELLEKLCETEGIKWIRILYAYPERITDRLLDVMASNEKIVKYIDIPIQHCNGEILKAMNRAGNRKKIVETVKKIREKMPDAVIRTTVITGFPGEREKQFNELCEFAKEMRFERLGSFAYSQEEGTPAAQMEQVPEEIREHRQQILFEQQAAIADEISAGHIGKTFEVLVEGYDGYIKHYFGRSYMDAPDIDSKVFFKSKEKCNPGEFVRVRIDDSIENELIGEKV